MKYASKFLILIFFAFVFMFVSCEREERGFRVETPNADRINSKQ